MTATDPDATAHYDKHSDAELHRAVEAADEQRDHIAAEKSDEALKANRTQRTAMAQELEDRDS